MAIEKSRWLALATEHLTDDTTVNAIVRMHGKTLPNVASFLVPITTDLAKLAAKANVDLAAQVARSVDCSTAAGRDAAEIIVKDTRRKAVRDALARHCDLPDSVVVKLAERYNDGQYEAKACAQMLLRQDRLSEGVLNALAATFVATQRRFALDVTLNEGTVETLLRSSISNHAKLELLARTVGDVPLSFCEIAADPARYGVTSELVDQATQFVVEDECSLATAQWLADNALRGLPFSFATRRSPGSRDGVSDTAVAAVFWHSELPEARRRSVGRAWHKMSLAEILVAFRDLTLTPSEFRCAVRNFSWEDHEVPLIDPVEFTDLFCAATTRLLAGADDELVRGEILEAAWRTGLTLLTSVFTPPEYRGSDEEADRVLGAQLFVLREMASVRLFLLEPAFASASDWVFQKSCVPDLVVDAVLSRLGTEESLVLPDSVLRSSHQFWSELPEASTRIARETPGLVRHALRDGSFRSSWIWTELFAAFSESLDVNQEILDTAWVFMAGWDGSISDLVQVVAVTTGHEVKHTTAAEVAAPAADHEVQMNPEGMQFGDQLALL
jgi:hypothetical protein